jgi:histone deacetylase complex subunit SAP18
MDASLKELTNLIRVSNPDVRRRGTRFDFAVVFAETRSPGYRMREIGSVIAGRPGPDDSATLAGKKFQIGDHIDVAITHPQRQMMRGSMRSRPY